MLTKRAYGAAPQAKGSFAHKFSKFCPARTVTDTKAPERTTLRSIACHARTHTPHSYMRTHRCHHLVHRHLPLPPAQHVPVRGAAREHARAHTHTHVHSGLRTRARAHTYTRARAHAHTHTPPCTSHSSSRRAPTVRIPPTS